MAAMTYVPYCNDTILHRKSSLSLDQPHHIAMPTHYPRNNSSFDAFRQTVEQAFDTLSAINSRRTIKDFCANFTHSSARWWLSAAHSPLPSAIGLYKVLYIYDYVVAHSI